MADQDSAYGKGHPPKVGLQPDNLATFSETCMKIKKMGPGGGGGRGVGLGWHTSPALLTQTIDDEVNLCRKSMLPLNEISLV